MRKCTVMADERPNPDRLLVQVQNQDARQRRGRLKVFFGMAAGVGKTYAMLEEARSNAGATKASKQLQPA